MKQEKKRGVGKAESAPDPQSMERREVNKLIAALALFGTGLGVNLEEAFAGLTQPVAEAGKKANADFIKITPPGTEASKVEQPSTELGKVKTPSADFAKTPRPSADAHKNLPTASPSESPALPAVQRHKNLPSVDMDKSSQPEGLARPGVIRAKPVPANIPQKSLIQGE